MNANLPQVFRVRQRFETPRVADPAAETAAQLAGLGLAAKVRPGQSVAMAVGSRGIANIPAIVAAAAGFFRGLGAEPFVVPAMGSHGGGTAEGQRAAVAAIGVTEAAVGCPIRSSLETVLLGKTPEGVPVHFDRLAFEADHVLVIGRVKPHTLFAGEIQSGLLKMLLIGLGKCIGANVYHRAVEDFSFDQIARSASREVLGRCPILAGLAIVENARDETGLIEGVLPQDFEAADKRLLAIARRWMARLPFPAADVLLIDRIGKDISGVGFDSNVVGRKFNDHKAVEGELPQVKRICVRGLTPATRGNAVGIGMAEFCRSDLLGAIDMPATRLNALTSGHLAAAMLPLDYPTDRAMIEAALATVGLVEPAQARLLWIADTLHLEELECSAAYLHEAQSRGDLEILTPLRALPVDPSGNLPPSVA